MDEQGRAPKPGVLAPEQNSISLTEYGGQSRPRGKPQGTPQRGGDQRGTCTPTLRPMDLPTSLPVSWGPQFWVGCGEVCPVHCIPEGG